MDCSWTEALLARQEQIRKEKSAIDRANLFSDNENFRKTVADGMFQTYLDGRIHETLAPQCLDKIEEPARFLLYVQSAFLKNSLEFYRHSKSSRVKRLLELLGARATSDGSLIFRLAGDTFAPPPTEFKGGFHRGSRSIFMDITRTDAGEWLVVLAHELLHDVDDLIPPAVQAYSNVDLVKRLVDVSQTNFDPSSLSREDRRAFKNWIQAGMERGLLAEVRAWTVTILIYQDGLREGLWGRVDWLDKVMQERRSGESWERFALRFLTARSEQPYEGIFKHELARNLLEEVKHEFLSGTRTLEFGSLSPFLD